MRQRLDLLILIGLFLALVLFILYGPTSRSGPTVGEQTPTTYSSGNGGALALFSWVRAMGYTAERLEYRAFELDERDAALLMLNPSTFVDSEEAQHVLDWVEQGGTLIYAVDSSIAFGPPSMLLDALEVDLAVYSATQLLETAQPQQPVLDQPPFATAQVRAGRVLRPRTSDIVGLLGQDDALVVAGLRRGRGYIYLSSAIYPFTNAGLRADGNPELVMNMLRRVPPGGRVLFDEYHHGFVAPPSPTSTATSTPWGWALTYAVLLTAAYLLLSGQRFGRPLPLREELLRRSSAEYVENMADLFQRAGKRVYILKHYREAFRRRLARPYGLNPQAADRELVRALANVHPADEAAAATLLERLGRQELSEDDMIRVVADADALLARTTGSGRQ